MDFIETIVMAIVVLWILGVVSLGVGSLEMIIIILLVLWLLGVLFAAAGGIIHILLVIAVIVMLVRLVRGKNMLTNK
jgi:hypothetical protein